MNEYIFYRCITMRGPHFFVYHGQAYNKTTDLICHPHELNI